MKCFTIGHVFTLLLNEGGTMFHFSRIATVSLIVFSLAACGTIQVGRDFDMRTFETRIERGATKQSEVRAWLGAPTGKGINMDTGGEHFDEWTYYFASGQMSDMSGAKVKMLQIKFDKQGVVRGYNWSASDQ
jgi:outer membrane protein assembly factor BamE (lipoprotein component of BamABCDE complex)